MCFKKTKNKAKSLKKMAKFNEFKQVGDQESDFNTTSTLQILEILQK